MIPGPDDQAITIASTPVVTVTEGATLREAARALRAADVAALVVPGDDRRPIAIISERDVVRALAEGADPDEVWAADVMTEEPRYATPAQSIRAVGREMLAAGVRHIPLIDEGETIGMLAERDVLAVLAAEGSSGPLATPHTGNGRSVEQELAHPGG